LRGKEEDWTQKSHVICLQSGDFNITSFYNYAKGCEAHNTNSELQSITRVRALSFMDLAKLGVEHFNNIFKVPQDLYIEKIIRMMEVLPSFVSQEENTNLMEAIME